MQIGDGKPTTPLAGTNVYNDATMNGLADSVDTMQLIHSDNEGGGGVLVYGTDFDLAVDGGGYNLLGQLTFVDENVYTCIFAVSAPVRVLANANQVVQQGN